MPGELSHQPLRTPPHIHISTDTPSQIHLSILFLIKVLWECCVSCPGGFPCLNEAVMLLLDRAGDAEESMRKTAVALCTKLWFSAESAIGEWRSGWTGDELMSGGFMRDLWRSSLDTHLIVHFALT